MSATPANEGATNASSPCSLPSTPLFPPLTETLLHVTTRSGEQKNQPENCKAELQAQIGLVMGADENISDAIAGGECHKQTEDRQTEKDGSVPGRASKCKLKGCSNDKAFPRRAPRLLFGSPEMPSSLLRPLDHEEERKLLQLEEQFKKERMQMLRRQNVLRRRRHAEKQQQLRATAAREQAAALQSRHQKLQAARVLMERGLAAAATSSSSVNASAVANQSDVASSTAVQVADKCSAHSSIGVTSAVVAPTAPAVCRYRREINSDGAAAGTAVPSRTASVPATTSDSLLHCHATHKATLSSAASTKSTQGRSVHQRCVRGLTCTSSSEHSGRGEDGNFCEARIPIPPDRMDGNNVSDAVDSGHTFSSNLSTIAECVIEGAAVRYKGTASSAGGCQAGYQCEAAQEMFSLWPCSRQTLLNAAVDHGGEFIVMQNQNINRLVMAASISSARGADLTYGNSDPPSAPPGDRLPVSRLICSRRVKTECEDLREQTALCTGKARPALRTGSDKVALPRSSPTIFRSATCCSSEPCGGSQIVAYQTFVSPAPDRASQRQQHLEELRLHKQQKTTFQTQRRHRVTGWQRCQEKHCPLPWQPDGKLELPHSHPRIQAQQHQPDQPQATVSGCLSECGDVDDAEMRINSKHDRQLDQLQLRHSQSFPSPTLHRESPSGCPTAQNDELARKRGDTENRLINCTHVRECSPCESIASSATTDSAKCGRHKHCPQEVQQQQVQLQAIPQQHDGLKDQKGYMRHLSQQPRRRVKVRSSISTRVCSYAGQFAVASRAKVEETNQIRVKSNQTAQKPHYDTPQALPAAAIIAGSPVLESSSCPHAGDASTYSSISDLVAIRLPVPAAISTDAAILTPCDSHAAPRGNVSVKMPFISARCRVITAARTQQADVFSSGTTGHKPLQKSPARPSAKASTTRGNSLHRTSLRHQGQQGPQQQLHSQQPRLWEIHMKQEQHSDRIEASLRNCTGVRVVDRKLKALIELQLQRACSSAAVAGRDPVSCVSTAAGNVNRNSPGIQSNEGVGHRRPAETRARATDGSRASPTANEPRAFSSSTADAASMLLHQENSSHSDTTFSQSPSVDSEWTQQHGEQSDLSVQDEQAAQATTLPATEQHQLQAFDLQQPQRPADSTQADAETATCRPHCAREGATTRDRSHAIEGVEYSEAQGDYTVGGTVRGGTGDISHRSDSPVEGSSVSRLDSSMNCGQCAKKALSTMEKRDEYLLRSTQSGGRVRSVEMAESAAVPCEEKEISAAPARGESPWELTEQDAPDIQAPLDYPCKTLITHEGRQRVKEGVQTAPTLLYDKTCLRVIRVRAAAALHVSDAQANTDTSSKRCPHVEPPERLQVRRRRLAEKRRIWCNLSAGPAGSSEGLQRSEEDNKTGREESAEEATTEEEFPQPPDLTTRKTKFCRRPVSRRANYDGRIAEGGCSRSKLTTSENSLVGLSCSVSCNSSTCLRTSTASDDAAVSLTVKDCAQRASACIKTSTRSSARQTVEPFAAPTSGSRRSVNCGTADQDQLPVRCTSGDRPLVRAAGESLGDKKCCEACRGKYRSSCDADPKLSPIRRHHTQHRRKIPQDQQQQRACESKVFSIWSHSAEKKFPDFHRQVISASSIRPLQVRRPASTNSSTPSGSHTACRYANAAPQQQQQSGPCPGLQEINTQRQHSAHAVSATTCCCHCFKSCYGEQHWQQRPHDCKGNTAAERENAQVERCISPRAKQASARHTHILLNSSGHSCRARSEHPALRHSGVRHRTFGTYNSRSCINCCIREDGSSPRSIDSRSSLGDRSTSRSGSECLQSLDRRRSSSGRQRRSHTTWTTAKEATECTSASSLPCMHVASQSCKRALRTTASTSASGGGRESRCAKRCRSKHASCCGALEGSMSNTSGSTCASAGDSIERCTFSSTLSRRNSSKLPLCEPPARKSMPLRASRTHFIKKATPKKSDTKDLKLKALANAEKKVEERLLLLDVNQKTLDVQHERRKYLQQQLLQQQQQELLKQQQQLQQQQLLTLVQYRSLSREGDLTLGTSVPCTESAVVETNTRRAATNDQSQRCKVSNQSSVHQGVKKNSKTHTAEVLRSNHSDVDSFTNTLGQTVCALQPGNQQMLVPLNNATSALLPTSAPFVAFPSAPVSISLLPGPLPCTISPTCSLRERTPLTTIASMTLPVPTREDVYSGREEEDSLPSKVLPSRRHQPLTHARTATVFPPLSRKRPEATDVAATAAPAGVTAAATPAGLRAASEMVKLRRASRLAETKSLQPSERAVLPRALPPLRAKRNKESAAFMANGSSSSATPTACEK